MNRYNLPALAKQARRRRKSITFRPIPTPPAFRMELHAGMNRVIKVWAKGRLQILAALDNRGLTTDDTTDDITSILDALSAEAAAVVAQVIAGLRATVRRAERGHTAKWAGAVRAQTGLDVTGLLLEIWDSPQVKAQIAWASGLIKNVSEEARLKISGSVLRGVTARTPSREVGKEISKALGISRRRANVIAADQANKLNATFTQLRQTEAGITQYRWRHSGKVNAREDHKAREGKIFDWDKPPSDGHPRSLPYCGCVAQAYIPLVDEV